MEKILEYTEVSGFSDEEHIPSFDVQEGINTILGIDTE